MLYNAIVVTGKYFIGMVVIRDLINYMEHGSANVDNLTYVKNLCVLKKVSWQPQKRLGEKS